MSISLGEYTNPPALGVGGLTPSFGTIESAVDVADSLGCPGYVNVLVRPRAGGLGLVGLFVVEVLATDSCIGQHRDAVGLHFEDAAGHEDELFAAVRHLDAHRAGLDTRDQRRVARVNAQFAGFARQRDETRFTREDRLFGTDHINVDGVHLCS